MDGGAVPEDSNSARKRKVHGLLKLYYGLNEEGKEGQQTESMDPCDINGPHFDPEHYLNKVRNLCCCGTSSMRVLLISAVVKLAKNCF